MYSDLTGTRGALRQLQHFVDRTERAHTQLSIQVDKPITPTTLVVNPCVETDKEHTAPNAYKKPNVGSTRTLPPTVAGTTAGWSWPRSTPTVSFPLAPERRLLVRRCGVDKSRSPSLSTNWRMPSSRSGSKRWRSCSGTGRRRRSGNRPAVCWIVLMSCWVQVLALEMEG